MIARNKPAVNMDTGTEPPPPGQNRRNFVHVLVSYRTFSRGWAFRPQLTMPFPSLVRNGGAPRPAMLARTASAWRDKLPSTGRISLEVVFKQKSLHISEIRAMAARTRFDDWKTNEIEECILLAGMNVEISPGHFRMAPVLLAAASGHALARWHQRSLDASPSALIADLRALALAAAISELDAGSEFAVQAGSGRWVGLLTSTSFEDVDRAERIFSARSFLS